MGLILGRLGVKNRSQVRYHSGGENRYFFVRDAEQSVVEEVEFSHKFHIQFPWWQYFELFDKNFEFSEKDAADIVAAAAATYGSGRRFAAAPRGMLKKYANEDILGMLTWCDKLHVTTWRAIMI